MQLTSKITRVPKIGPKYEKLLSKLEIETIEDLLYHFPFRYEDYSVVKKINELKVNDVATIKVTLEKCDNIYTRNRKKLTKALFSDETGAIEVIWFNMHYIKNTLTVGEKYSLSGKVGSFNNKLSFLSPEVEKQGMEINTARLVPIYPETYGVSSKWLRTRINDVLSSGMDIEEFLPEEIIKEEGFTKLDKSLNLFHFPNTYVDVSTAKKRFSFEELFMELLKVEERKSAWNKEFEGSKYNLSKHKKQIDSFIEKLPFELSESQNKALEDIFNEISNKHPMNMLLEGDVGSGKTIVAIITAFLSYLNGYKVLYMAPTEILANQHFETFTKFLDGLDIKISLKTGTTKKFERDADIIIGTHALLYMEEEIDNLGLIVIDEQQRFGVEQRAKLMKMGVNKEIPHLLTMTATPIPRTLALTLYGDLSITSLKAPKTKPKNVKTWILAERKREEAFKWILDQKRPTFIVCPLIEESEFEVFENVKAAQVEYEKLKKGVFKKLNVGLLHGKMKAKEKEEVVEKFRKGEIQVLVSTPVIEVGIDIPDATIMVIESAERYGLASLHQLRGRIGRAGQEAYCMLFMSKYSRNGMSRLKNLEKFDTGLELAEIDMKLRGQGDIYGIEQHGFKQFKVADISDVALLEKVKKAAQTYFKKIDDYPKLKEKLDQKSSNFVQNN